MKLIVTILLILLGLFASAQSNTDFEGNPQAAQLEDLNSDDESATENDYNAQQLEYFFRHPININSDDIEQIPLITSLLADNLRQYRKLLGDLIDVHELIAVPGFNADLVRELLPIITVKRNQLSKQDVSTLLNKGQQTILARLSYTPEKAEGYSNHKFNGSGVYVLSRYRYQYRNILQYGVLMEKDAGEKLFVGGAKPEFISFHLALRNQNVFKMIAIGDYTIALGQGLIHWQGLAFGKGAEIVSIKRYAEPIRPYSSAGEFHFNRGLATTITLGKYDITAFMSSRKLSANIDEHGNVTSLQTTGLHRTKAELDTRNVLRVNMAGTSIVRKLPSGHIALNAIYHHYAFPLQKKDQPYNQYAIRGQVWHNESIDYAFHINNYHVFGEIAADRNAATATLNGVIASFGNKVDAVLLHRLVSKRYRAVYGNIFSENGEPSDENGLYFGLRLSPARQWRIDLYADVYSSSWLRYTLDAPSYGSTYYVKLSYRPGKQTELYTRLRVRMKPVNVSTEETSEFSELLYDTLDGPSLSRIIPPKFDEPSYNNIYNWRAHLSASVTPGVSMRWRLEVCKLNRPSSIKTAETGYLFFTDLLFKPFRSHFSGNFRVAVFECPSYDTRIYAYENDVLFVNNTQPLYNNGVRICLNLKGKWSINALNSKQLAVYVKAASTVYTNVSTIGSDITSIAGNRNSAMKLQFFLTL